MKKNITYLLGAGASAKALPIVAHFNFRLERFLFYLQSNNDSNSFDDFINDVYFILQESQKHSTIDTVAKKYFHNLNSNKDNLKKLKKVLTVFFIYEQISTKVHSIPTDFREDNEAFISKKSFLDYRYDSFIASLLLPKQNEIVFPENVKILTWNYDSQFEIALKQFTSGPSFFDIQEMLSCYPRLISPLENEYFQKIKGANFKILHLNGKCHYYFENKKQLTNNKYISSFDKQNNTFQNTLSIIQEAVRADSSFSSMTFSWERNSSDFIQTKEITQIIDEAKNVMDNTDILVIIGYSFPFFNRDIDKELLQNKQLDKIYVQHKNASNIKEVILNVFTPQTHESNIIAYDNVNQFLIPPELDADYPDEGPMYKAIFDALEK